MENVSRYRFSLAHEIAHFDLHRSIYEEIPEYSTIEEFKAVYAGLDQKMIKRLEIQADNYASLLLIPDFALDNKIPEALMSVSKEIEDAKKGGVSRETYLPYVTDSLGVDLSDYFEVSSQAIKYRIINDPRYATQIP